MKRIISLALVATLGLGLVACGEQKTEKPSASTPVESKAAAKETQKPDKKDDKKDEAADPLKDPRIALEQLVNKLENDAIYKNVEAYVTEETAKNKSKFAEILNKAKETLKNEKASKEDLLAFLDYKDGDKKHKGIIHKAMKLFLVHMDLDGEGVVLNKHTNKKYAALKDNSFVLSSKAPDFVKHLKITTVTKEAYDKFPKAADTATQPTPKYDRETLDKENYEVKELGEGKFQVTIKKLPKDVIIVKPVVVYKLDGDQKIENGYIVYVDAAYQG